MNPSRWLALFSLFVSLDLISSFAPIELCLISRRQPNVTIHTGRLLIRMISSGFSFNDGEQILVSAQKPLGIVLEQDSESGIIIVAEVDPAGSAGKGGVKVGDILVAVQNASTENVDIDDVLAFVGNGPRVMNLRLMRPTQ